MTLDTGGGNGSSYTVTFNVECGYRRPDDVRQCHRRTRTTKLVMTAGNTLTDSGGITLSNVNSIIDGAGTISVGGAISGTGTIAAGIAGQAAVPST